jgi:ATP phosphoribosyltransferase regulatory subunit
MTASNAPLLPEGLRDRLPPEAEAASRVTRAMIDAMAGYGYARVAPPIAEYRETLAGDTDDPVARDLLRFTDPVSRRTLAIRPDITRQIGRIAGTLLADVPRPLRLSYAGQVVKLAATTLWPEREMLQIGAELIGNHSVAAASEVARLAVECLRAAGVESVQIDLTLPDLVDTLAERSLPLPVGGADAVRTALDAKDAGALQRIGAAAYLPLLGATGDAATALPRLAAFDTNKVLASRIAALTEIAEGLADVARVTIDPTERHGFAYHSWLGFTLFATDSAARGIPVGRGGAYSVSRSDGSAEPAMGFSLYPDPLVAAGLGAEAEERRLFLPLGHDAQAAATLRAEGWITVAALSADDEAAGCTHRLEGRDPVAY